MRIFSFLPSNNFAPTSLPMRRFAAWGIVTGFAWVSTALQAQNATDSVILNMRDAFKRGASAQIEANLPQVQGHLLEPLATYWAAKSQLERATSDQMQNWLGRLQGTYYEDRLRNDWLLHLGLRRDWSQFLAHWPLYRMNDDKQVRCYGLYARYSTEGKLPLDQAAEVSRLWLDQKDADDACALLAGELIHDKLLSDSVAWQRARIGVEFNRQRVMSQAVGSINPDWVASANAVFSQPDAYLNNKLTAIRHKTKELVTLALVRLASSNPADAAAHMMEPKWTVQLTHEERSWVWGAIGRAAAQKLMPEALAWYGKGQPEHMHPEHLGWWVRAALRQGQWQQVGKAIAAMPEVERRNPTWAYWNARALQQTGNPELVTQAKAAFQLIASPNHFYGQLALEELGQAIAVPAKPLPLTDAEKDQAKNNMGLQRAIKAIAIGLRAEGVKEWNYTINLHQLGGMSDRELLAAADLACQLRIWDRCINTSDRTTQQADYGQRYPMPHRDAVIQRARSIGLDPAYVYGLIRQESRFITDAKSTVGASGLMQVMPATASWTARKMGMADFEPHMINDRDTNIAIGTGYLQLVLNDFEGSMPLAAAAYNAGPGRSRTWRNGPVMEGAIWAENVPFSETRDYVKKVLSNTTNYAAIITGQPQSLKKRMGWVGPRGGQSPLNAELP